MRARILPVVVTVLCLAVGTTARAEIMKWTIGGIKREALVIPPSKAYATGKAPVVFAFHGHGGDMHDAQEGMHFENAWPEAVVVYMQGLPTNALSDPQGYGWIYDKERDGDRDLKFVDAVLATLRAKFPVDDRRIYATGFSNGGMFTYVLWGTRPNVFAAFAAVAGESCPQFTSPSPSPSCTWRADRTCRSPSRISSRPSRRRGTWTAPTEKGARAARDCLFYASSRGTPVVTYIHPGGHVYPVIVTKLIVEFFKDYKLAN